MLKYYFLRIYMIKTDLNLIISHAGTVIDSYLKCAPCSAAPIRDVSRPVSRNVRRNNRIIHYFMMTNISFSGQSWSVE